MIEFVNIPEDRMKNLREDRKGRGKLYKFSNASVELSDTVKVECEDPVMLLRVVEVIKAFGRGFDLEDSIDLLDEEYILETLNIGEFSGKSKNRKVILKGRIIGREGKVKDRIQKITGVKLVVYGKTVSLIGNWKNVRIARKAVEMLLNGAMHNTVYQFLETQRLD